MVIINEHEAMRVETVNLINMAVFQIVIIRAVVANQTRTHKKITSYKVIIVRLNKNIILFNQISVHPTTCQLF